MAGTNYMSIINEPKTVSAEELERHKFVKWILNDETAFSPDSDLPSFSQAIMFNAWMAAKKDTEVENGVFQYRVKGDKGWKNLPTIEYEYRVIPKL